MSLIIDGFLGERATIAMNTGGLFLCDGGNLRHGTTLSHRMVHERKEQHPTTNTFARTFITSLFDWTKTIALAQTQARQEFETTVLHADGLSEEQLKQAALDFENRFNRALDAAKHHRKDPESMFCSAMRNWARGKTIELLSEKLAGKPIRKDYHEVFEGALYENLDRTDIAWSWDLADTGWCHGIQPG